MNAWDVVEKPVAHTDGTFSTAARTLLSPASALQPLALRSMFWRPKYSTESAWLEHVPFAFWLIEAHRPRLVVEVGAGPPVFYFSFCQAIEKLELESSCIRIAGQGRGDSEQAAADEEARAYNASQYSSFSLVEAGDIRAARHQFEDGSIDVLHIADTADMISGEDIADWMPKLSTRGVVLMHGAAEQQVSVPARRISASLRRVHPMFEFAFGNGLTLVAMGAEQPEFIKLLCMASGNLHARRALHDVFFRLGRACADSHAVTVARATSHRLNESIEEYKRRLDAVQAELRNAELSLSSQAREFGGVQQKLDGQLEKRAAERGHLSEKITVLQEVRVDLKMQIETLQGRADAAAAGLVARAEQVGRLEQAVALREARINELQARVGALQGDLRDKETEWAELRQQMEARQLEQEAEIGKWRDRAEKLERVLQQKEADRKTAHDERDAFERQVSELQADLRRTAARVNIAQQELVDLTRFLFEAEQKLELSETQQAQAEASASALRAELGRSQEVAALREAVVAEERELQARELHASEVRIKALHGRFVVLQRVLDRATGGADGSAAEVVSEQSDPLEEQCKAILRSGFFDAEWYLHQYRDVAEGGGDPLRHYLLFGATELRDPGPFFSTAAYLAVHGGRLPEGTNPLIHHLAGESGELGLPGG